MRICFLFLVFILFFANLAASSEILGRIVEVNPKTKQIFVVVFDRKFKKTLVIKNLTNVSRFRPGDVVRLDLEIKNSKNILVKGIKPFKSYDRTGVRRRLKMRRGFGGKRH